MLAHYKQKFLTLHAEKGFIGLSKKTLTVIAHTLCTINMLPIYERDLQNPIKNITPDLHLTFRLATSDDIHAMNKEDYNYSRRDIHYCSQRLHQGDRCLLALHRDKIVAYLWIMNGYMELSQYHHIPLPAGKTYLYKVFVLKDFRGKRILNAMHTHLFPLLQREGIRHLLTTVNVHNHSAIRAKKRAGFTEVGQITQVRFFGFQYDYISQNDLRYLQAT